MMVYDIVDEEFFLMFRIKWEKLMKFSKIAYGGKEKMVGRMSGCKIAKKKM